MTDQEFRDHFMRMMYKAYSKNENESQEEIQKDGELQRLLFNLLSCTELKNAIWEAFMSNVYEKKSWELLWRNDD